jgi:hypothetical protein
MSKRNLLGFSVAVLIGVFFVATFAISQEKSKSPKADPTAPGAAGGMDQAAMMKTMEEAGAPGPIIKPWKRWPATSST